MPAPIDAGLYDAQPPQSQLADPGATTVAAPAPQVPSVETPPPAPVPKHSPWAVSAAESLGFSQDEIEGSHPSALLRMIAEARSGGGGGQTSAPGAGGGRGQQHHQPDPAPQIDWGTETVDGREVKIKDEDINPGIRNAFKMLFDRIAGLESALNRVNGHVAKQTATTLAQRLDATFSKYPDTFGSGPIGSVAENQRALRALVWQQVAAMGDREKAGRSEEQLVELIISRAFPNAVAGQGQQQQPTPFQPTPTAIPTARQPGRLPPGDQRATGAAANLAAQRGQQPPTRTEIGDPLSKAEFL